MSSTTIRIALPKGRIFKRVEALLDDCGLPLRKAERAYRPDVDDERFVLKILKAQNIARLVELGSHDLGFTGHDWVKETSADVVELYDLGFDPVRVVVAAPRGTEIATLRALPRVVVVSEYERLTRHWLETQGLTYHFVRSYGATEVFPPEDADLIVDNTATGETLVKNGLAILETVLHSTTRLIANREALDDPEKRRVIDELLLLVRAVMDARARVILEMNIDDERLAQLMLRLPAMRSPTVSPLYAAEGTRKAWAVKVAVRRAEVARLVPELKRLGATDILETAIRKVIP